MILIGQEKSYYGSHRSCCKKKKKKGILLTMSKLLNLSGLQYPSLFKERVGQDDLQGLI